MTFERRLLARPAVLARVALVAATAALLAGCETTGSGPSASAAPTAQTAQAPKPPEPPLTRTHAAEECWMMTEKNRALSLDKRADVVTKCIDDKMKTAAPAAPPQG